MCALSRASTKNLKPKIFDKKGGGPSVKKLISQFYFLPLVARLSSMATTAQMGQYLSALGAILHLRTLGLLLAPILLLSLLLTQLAETSQRRSLVQFLRLLLHLPPFLLLSLLVIPHLLLSLCLRLFLSLLLFLSRCLRRRTSASMEHSGRQEEKSETRRGP